MNSFGGIINFTEGSFDFTELLNMSRATSVGSVGQCESFAADNASIFCSMSDCGSEALPYICTRRGNTFALAFEGALDARAVMEKYFAGGLEALTDIGGAFALALYDGEKKCLILLRGKKGSAPLFFSMSQGMVRFSSKAFGLLSSKQGFSLDIQALAMHITAPAGTFGVGDIYRGIYELNAHECAVFNSLGLSRFAVTPYNVKSKVNNYCLLKKEKRIVLPLFSCYDDLLGECLSDALIAFGYPQFDFLMPTFCLVLKNGIKQARQKIYFYDNIRQESRTYAEERALNLGGLYGIKAVGVPCRTAEQYSLEDLKKMQKALYLRLLSKGNGDMRQLQYVLGQERLFDITFELERSIRRSSSESQMPMGGLIRNIRTIGLLCQTVDIVS